MHTSGAYIWWHTLYACAEHNGPLSMFGFLVVAWVVFLGLLKMPTKDDHRIIPLSDHDPGLDLGFPTWDNPWPNLASYPFHTVERSWVVAVYTAARSGIDLGSTLPMLFFWNPFTPRPELNRQCERGISETQALENFSLPSCIGGSEENKARPPRRATYVMNKVI